MSDVFVAEPSGPVSEAVHASSDAELPQDVSAETSDGPARQRRPLYARLLRLRHIHLSGWQRAVLGEGMAVIGVLLAMADLASAWTILCLPLAVGLVVKAHDVLAGYLTSQPLRTPCVPALRTRQRRRPQQGRRLRSNRA